MTGFPTTSFVALLPVAILTLGAIALLLSEVFLVSGKRAYQSILTVIFATAAALAAVALPRTGAVFGGQASADGFSTFVTVIVCAGLALSALVGASWLEARSSERGEFYALATFAAAGMVLLGMASDLLVAFISLEVMSISTYALAAYLRRGLRPSEAAFKYLVLGAVSSALFVYGSALLYGASGSTAFARLAEAHGSPLFLVGMGLVLAGIAFKVAAVPFHAWTPDVYEGAPTPVTAFMAAGVKTASFAVLVRIFLAAEAGVTAGTASFGALVSTLAVLTMVAGNLLALPQCRYVGACLQRSRLQFWPSRRRRHRPRPCATPTRATSRKSASPRCTAATSCTAWDIFSNRGLLTTEPPANVACWMWVYAMRILWFPGWELERNPH